VVATPSSWLLAMDRARGRPGLKGLRPSTAVLRTVTWSGTRPGEAGVATAMHATVAAGAPLALVAGFTIPSPARSMQIVLGTGGAASVVYTITGTAGGVATVETVTATGPGTYQGHAGWTAIASLTSDINPGGTTAMQCGECVWSDLPLLSDGQPPLLVPNRTNLAQVSGGRFDDSTHHFHLTPAFVAYDGTAGGYTPAQLSASSTARNIERHVVTTGPGEPTLGSVWTIVQTFFERPMTYEIRVRRTERTT
jgi:hypothetical protein